MSAFTVLSFTVVTTFSSWVLGRTVVIPQPDDTRADKVVTAALLWVIAAVVVLLAYRIAGRLL
jgi:hypothetical protein